MATALSNGKAKGPLGRVALSPRRKMIINADEVVINRIPVNFVEFEEETQQVGKRTIVSRTTIQRTAQINDYIPAELYDVFMAMYDDLRESMSRFSSTQEQPEQTEDEAVEAPSNQMNSEQLSQLQDLQYKLVLAVWQITEPDMDEQRLRQGLDEDQLVGLFTHFFSRLTRQKKRSALRDGSTSNAPEPEAGEE